MLLFESSIMTQCYIILLPMCQGQTRRKYKNNIMNNSRQTIMNNSSAEVMRNIVIKLF